MFFPPECFLFIKYEHRLSILFPFPSFYPFIENAALEIPLIWIRVLKEATLWSGLPATKVKYYLRN